MADSFGTYIPIKPSGLLQQQQKSTPINPISFVDRIRANPNYTDSTKKGIIDRNAATSAREKQERRKKDLGSALVEAEQVAESMQEGNIAFGKIGKNHPGDTRMAEVLRALGINEDLMSAIIASAQIRSSDNR